MNELSILIKKFKALVYVTVLSITVVSNTYSCSAQTDELAQKYPIIPTPQVLSYGNNEIAFETYNISKSDFKDEENQLITFFTEQGIETSKKGLKIQLIKKNFSIENLDEAYELSIDSDIKILASTEKGAYYAIKTLQQIFRKQDKNCFLPKLEIKDWSAFKIRKRTLSYCSKSSKVVTPKLPRKPFK